MWRLLDIIVMTRAPRIEAAEQQLLTSVRPRRSPPFASARAAAAADRRRKSLPQFYLNVLLREAGLSEADIEVVDLTPEDAGQAFLLKEVDAAVTFEPWLTQGKEAAHGHLLTDSSEKPGLLVDCLLTTPGVLE